MTKRRILYELGDSGRDQFFTSIEKELQKIIPHEKYFHVGKAGYSSAKKITGKNNILLLNYKEQTFISKPDLKFLRKIETKYDFNIWDSWEVSAQRKKSRRNIHPDKILIWYEYMIKKILVIVLVTDF